MRSIGKSLVLSLLSTLAMSGCGPSPLLNHVDASDPKLREGVDSTEPKPEPAPDSIEPVGNPGRCTLAFPKQKLCGNISWVAQPQVGKDSSFRIQFHSMDNRKPQEPTGKPRIELWMPSMGHGSSPVTVQHATDSVGAFDVTSVYFIMGGDWEVRVRLMNDGITEQASIALEL